MSDEIVKVGNAGRLGGGLPVVGQMDIEKFENSTNEAERRAASLAIRRDRAIRKRMSPPGAIPGIEPALEERRLAFGIIDDNLMRQPAYDRVFVWQFPDRMYDEAFIPGGTVLMPEATRQRRANEAPQGILLAAGLKAMEILWSHGYEIGDHVVFVRLSPWYIETARLESGDQEHILSLRVGDLVESVDLGQRMREGKIWKERQPNGTWALRDEDGVRVPIDPRTPDEY